MNALDFHQLRPLNPRSLPIADAACPLCGPDCRSEANRRRKVLRIWDDGAGFLTYTCARCGVSGYARDEHARGTIKPRPAPRPEEGPPEDKADLARYLWSRSEPARGSIVEAYLRSRHVELMGHAGIRFLPGRGEHHPAMISRFGVGEPLTGIHLTKLKPDGSGKAEVERDKIMIGPSAGQPIVVNDAPDSEQLIVAEGIEDALSLAVVTGWTAWAAGAAVRIPAVVKASATFSLVYLAVDDDKAGRRALDDAKAHADGRLVPVRIGHLLGRGLDSNKALGAFGRDALLAAVEWADAQARFARREIGFSAMQAVLARCAVSLRTGTEVPALAVRG